MGVCAELASELTTWPRATMVMIWFALPMVVGSFGRHGKAQTQLESLANRSRVAGSSYSSSCAVSKENHHGTSAALGNVGMNSLSRSRYLRFTSDGVVLMCTGTLGNDGSLCAVPSLAFIWRIHGSNCGNDHDYGSGQNARLHSALGLLSDSKQGARCSPRRARSLAGACEQCDRGTAGTDCPRKT